MSFADAVKRFAKLTKEAGEKIIRETEVELYSGIVLQTPVKEGFARGGWIPSIGVPAGGVPGVADKSGGATVAAIKEQMDSSPVPRKSYISNNLPYIEWLEDGTSGQAPHGMVGINIARARMVFESKVRRHKV